jgi:uncharacterized spore protein YtfJ
MDIENLVAKAADNLSVRRAFGTAYEKDGMLIIPVAIVAGGGGGGTSRTRRGDLASDDPPADDATPQDSGRTDAGGGFGGLILPSGAYVVKGDQVRWVPAVDATIAVLASLTLVRLLARIWTRQRRRRLWACAIRSSASWAPARRDWLSRTCSSGLESRSSCWSGRRPTGSARGSRPG